MAQNVLQHIYIRIGHASVKRAAQQHSQFGNQFNVLHRHEIVLHSYIRQLSVLRHSDSCYFPKNICRVLHEPMKFLHGLTKVKGNVSHGGGERMLGGAMDRLELDCTRFLVRFQCALQARPVLTQVGRPHLGQVKRRKPVITTA